MLIKCPKCNTGYAVEPAMIPEAGKKVRCSQCGEVWLCTPADLYEPEAGEEARPAPDVSSGSDAPVPDTPAAEQTSETPAASRPEELEAARGNEMQEIFARLSEQTEKLFQKEKEAPVHKKIWSRVKFGLGLQRRQNRRVLYAVVALLMLLSAFYLRYEIVRLLPFMEYAYAAVGVDSVIPGEGLEFQNINRNEYEEDYVRKMEIRGFIVNTTRRTVEIPVIHAELLDKNAQLLQTVNQEPPVKRITTGGRVAFQITVTKPSSLTKYIYLTFVKGHPEGTVKSVSTHVAEEVF